MQNSSMEENNKKSLWIVDDKYCFEEETTLTVHKTSVFFPGDGFVVYNHEGQLLFRFDSYGPESKPMDELVLMDAFGKCLLTLRRKVILVFFFVAFFGYLRLEFSCLSN